MTGHLQYAVIPQSVRRLLTMMDARFQ